MGIGLGKDELERLKAPFSAEAIAYKPGAMNAEGTRALALPHITARDVFDRLDEVVPGEWSTHWEAITAAPRPVVKVSLDVRNLHFEDCGEADNDDPDAWKSAVSDGIKRVAVHLGIGRFLYELTPMWLACESRMDAKSGKLRFVRFTEGPMQNGAKQAETAKPAQTVGERKPTVTHPEEPISTPQLNMLTNLFPRKGFAASEEEGWLQQSYGVANKADLKRGQASQAIDTLLKMPSIESVGQEGLPIEDEEAS